MATTLKFLGREFAVTATRTCPHGGGTVYELVGKRGATYYTMRNRKNPELMFLTGPLSVMTKNVWFTDKHGTLEVVRG